MNTTTKLALVALTAALLAAPTGMALETSTTDDTPLVDILSDGESCSVGNGNADERAGNANPNACN